MKKALTIILLILVALIAIDIFLPLFIIIAICFGIYGIYKWITNNGSPFKNLTL